MVVRANWRVCQAVAGLAGLLIVTSVPLVATAADASAPPAAVAAPATQPVTPKPLTDHANRGLGWLVKHQRPDGGWSQGEASLDQYRQGEVGDTSDVADTCMAALALLRSGNTPTKGKYAANIVGAVNFVCGQVEKAPPDGLFITDIKGTRVQTKLGQYIDTFASALLLAEVKDAMPDAAGRKRVIAALDKTMDKIEKNQKEDGRWVEAHDGWASALCQSMATKAVNRAAQQGAKVDHVVVERAQQFAARNFDAKNGAVGGAGSANVELYARAANLEAFQDSANTDSSRKQGLEKRSERARSELEVAKRVADSPDTQPAAAEAARQTIDRAQKELKDVDGQLGLIRQNEATLKQAQQRLVERLDDKQFVAGFGSNGGEEFLSYMNIGESLALKGGDEFAKWDKQMAENLDRIQNEDGSWSGQHCITGRTFCTAAALMVLTVDRSVGAPITDKVRSHK